MTTQNDTSILTRVRDLHDHIAQGRIIEALHEFYAEDCVLQENLNEPCRGRAANLQREEEWLASVAEFKGFEVRALAVDGNISMVETSLDYVTTGGDAVHMEQVARAIWRDGKIVEERYYHG